MAKEGRGLKFETPLYKRDRDRLRAQVARLEGELAEVQKELESKDEELRLAREDFSPEAWEDLLQRLEKSEAAIRAKDAALAALCDKLDEIAEATVGIFTMAAIHHAPYTGPTYEQELKDARAALSPDAGKGWLPPEVGEQVRLLVTTFNEMLARKMPDEEIVGVMDGLLDNLDATLDALKGVEFGTEAQARRKEGSDEQAQ